MALSFVTIASGPAGAPLHVTVYDNAGVAVDPATVTWTGLPAGVTASPDATGYNFNSSTVVAANATAKSGVASGVLTLQFTAPPLKFTVP